MKIPTYLAILIILAILVGVSSYLYAEYDDQLNIPKPLPSKVSSAFDDISSNGSTMETYVLQRCTSDKGTVYLISNVNLTSTVHYFDESGNEIGVRTYSDDIGINQMLPTPPVKILGCDHLKEVTK